MLLKEPNIGLAVTTARITANASLVAWFSISWQSFHLSFLFAFELHQESLFSQADLLQCLPVLLLIRIEERGFVTSILHSTWFVVSSGPPVAVQQNYCSVFRLHFFFSFPVQIIWNSVRFVHNSGGILLEIKSIYNIQWVKVFLMEFESAKSFGTLLEDRKTWYRPIPTTL